MKIGVISLNEAIKMKSKEYNQGYTDGYQKAMKDCSKIREETDKEFKPLLEAINKLRRFY